MVDIRPSRQLLTITAISLRYKEFKNKKVNSLGNEDVLQTCTFIRRRLVVSRSRMNMQASYITE